MHLAFDQRPAQHDRQAQGGTLHFEHLRQAEAPHPSRQRTIGDIAQPGMQDRFIRPKIEHLNSRGEGVLDRVSMTQGQHPHPQALGGEVFGRQQTDLLSAAGPEVGQYDPEIIHRSVAAELPENHGGGVRARIAHARASRQQPGACDARRQREADRSLQPSRL